MTLANWAQVCCVCSGCYGRRPGASMMPRLAWGAWKMTAS